ncbi:MAG: hypothetical protein EA363_08510, partial [Balneolaceae bacterium]
DPEPVAGSEAEQEVNADPEPVAGSEAEPDVDLEASPAEKETAEAAEITDGRTKGEVAQEEASEADAASSENKGTLITENVMAPLDVQKELLRSESSSLQITNDTNGNAEKSDNGVKANGLASAIENGKEAVKGNEAVNGNGKLLHNFHQRITLDPEQAGYDAGLITELLIHHLSEKAGVEVTVTLEINAKLPDGLEQELARIMMECVKPQKTPKLELVNR